MSQAGSFNTGGGGGGGSVTINGDSGFISGSNLTIFSNIAANNAGASVSFDNSATTSLFNTTDAMDNVFIGKNSGVQNVQSQFNVSLGSGSLASITNSTDGGNVSIGYTSLSQLNAGAGFNTSVGTGALFGLLSGTENIALGHLAGQMYTTESQNICIGNQGTPGDQMTTRIGSGITEKCFISGIVENTLSNATTVVIDTITDQVGILTGSPMVSLGSTQFSVLTTGTHPIITVDQDFIIENIITLTVTAVGAAGDAQCSIGYNSPSFDNILSTGLTFDVNNNGTVSTGTPSGAFVPSGQTITLNVTTPDSTATTMNVKVYVLGFYA